MCYIGWFAVCLAEFWGVVSNTGIHVTSAGLLSVWQSCGVRSIIQEYKCYIGWFAVRQSCGVWSVIQEYMLHRQFAVCLAEL